MSDRARVGYPRMKNRGVYFFAHVLVPVAIGASIYVGWRSTDILVFDWIDAIGGSDLIVRPKTELPFWVLYALPDGLWVYAYTSWMLLIWRRPSLWVWSGLILAVGAEVGQLMGFVSGTYSLLDVAFYVGGFCLSRVLYAQATFVDTGYVNDGSSGLR